MSYHLEFTFFLLLLVAKPRVSLSATPLPSVSCSESSSEPPVTPAPPCTLRCPVTDGASRPRNSIQDTATTHNAFFLFLYSNHFQTIQNILLAFPTAFPTTELTLLGMVHSDPWLSKTHVEPFAIFSDVMFPMCMSVLTNTEISVLFSCPVTHRCEILPGCLIASESTWHSMLSHITSTSFSRGH